MSSKPVKKMVVVKSRASTKITKPKLAKRLKSNIAEPSSDVEIEFEEEQTNRTKEDEDVLDGHLLASRDTQLADSDEEAIVEAITQAPTKDIVGSKARLLALMNKNIEPSDDDGNGLETMENSAISTTDQDNNETDSDKSVNDYQSSKTVKKSRTTKPKKISKVSTIKRGPGRPPKNEKKDPLPRKGIHRSPQNPDSFVEVLYDQPVIMKKIFSFFKSVAASEIQIIFRPKDIIFYAMDHNAKTRVRVRIDAEKLNFYYCKDVLDIGVSQKEMEMILNKVDKDYSSIVILSDVITTRRNLTLVFENDIQIDELHRIDLIASYNKMENETAFIDEEYTVKFNFPGKYFKKTVGDIKSMSSQLSITQEDNESPLIFEYLTENKRIQSKHTVKDSSKIKLESTLAKGETFRVDVCIDYLKPISSSQIADEITIFVDENKSFMTKSYIDGGTIEIKTLTEIIDDRPEDDDD